MKAKKEVSKKKPPYYEYYENYLRQAIHLSEKNSIIPSTLSVDYEMYQKIAIRCKTLFNFLEELHSETLNNPKNINFMNVTKLINKCFSEMDNLI